MRSCKDISELMSRSLDMELSWRERWALKTHLMMCGGCARLSKQLTFLRDVSAQTARADHEAEESAGPTLSEDARERIRATLAEAGSTTEGF